MYARYKTCPRIFVRTIGIILLDSTGTPASPSRSEIFFDYISTLATASSAVKPIAKALGGAKFEGLPMIGIAIIGFALAALSYQNAINKQVVTVAAEQSESGEIDDDEL